MDYIVSEKKYREIERIYHILSEQAYPYQKQEILESTMDWITVLKTRARIRFFAVYKEGAPVLIAPLKIFKNGIKVLGTQEGYNMSDFVYSTDDCRVLSDAILALLNYLNEKVYANKGFDVEWRYLYADSLSWKAVHNLNNEGRISSWRSDPVNNVQIPLKENYDAYFKGLSKHARQNVRTAYNRIARDNHRLAVHFYPMGEGDEVKAAGLEASKKYSAIYMKRLSERYHRKGVRFFLKKLLAKIYAGKQSTFSTPFTLLADISIDDEIAAYAKCYLDKPHKIVTVPNLAIDIKWGFYSPGILLVNELVKYVTNMGGIEYLSMGRGEEPYKYEMGGEVYLTYNCEFSFPGENESRDTIVADKIAGAN